MREITCIAMDITTHCDRRCPDCCCGIGISRKLQHHGEEYFMNAAWWFRDIPRLHITGGEPTLHPEFRELIPMLREFFNPERMTLQTNGFRLEQFQKTIKENFDTVFYTEYGDKPSTTQTLTQLGVPYSVYEAGGPSAPNFTPRTRRGSGKPCERGFSDTVAYCDGKLYPCCVGPGVEGAVGIEPTENWKEEILKVPLPCENCFFSPEE